MSLKRSVPHLTVVICMGPGKEEALKERLKAQSSNYERAEFILCGGDVNKALDDIRSAKKVRSAVDLYTDRFLPRGEWLFESARGIISDYNVYYA